MAEYELANRTVHGSVARRSLPAGGKTGTPQLFCPKDMPFDKFRDIVTSQQRAQVYAKATATFQKLADQAKADFAKHDPQDVARVGQVTY